MDKPRPDIDGIELRDARELGRRGDLIIDAASSGQSMLQVIVAIYRTRFGNQKLWIMVV